MVMNPAQSRAARGLLEWSQDDLARKAGLGLSTVRDFETRRREVSTQAVTAIRRALEGAGVQFIAAGKSGGPGVRLRK
jgi:transcriptional regulator with XRE-family HTH domain